MRTRIFVLISLLLLLLFGMTSSTTAIANGTASFGTLTNVFGDCVEVSLQVFAQGEFANPDYIDQSFTEDTDGDGVDETYDIWVDAVHVTVVDGDNNVVFFGGAGAFKIIPDYPFASGEEEGPLAATWDWDFATLFVTRPFVARLHDSTLKTGDINLIGPIIYQSAPLDIATLNPDCTMKLAFTNNNTSVPEGSTASASGDAPLRLASTTVSVDATLGQVSSTPTGVWQWQYDAVEGPDPTGQVTLTATASNGETSNLVLNLDIANLPPVVEAGPDSTAVVGQNISLIGSFTDPGVLDTHTATIDFGDGTGPMDAGMVEQPGSGTFVADHVYTAPGTFTVNMCVMDDDPTDNLGCDSRLVTVAAAPPPSNTAPVARFTIQTPCLANGPCHFDGSTSSDVEGPISSYAWDFGDGVSGGGVAPSHSYGDPGTYDVTLTVTDSGSLQNSVTHSVRVLSPPDAFIDGPSRCQINTNCDFSGLVSFDEDGTISSYSWNFGDGSTASGPMVTHVYTSTGNFTVSLVVTDNDGLTGSTARIVTAFQLIPPIAVINAPATCDLGLPCNFSGSASSDPDGAIVQYRWTFGDGLTGSSVSPSHTYNSAGNFTVMLTVTDDSGLTNTASAIVRVPGPPVAVDDSYSIDQDTTLNGNVLANDHDPNGDPLTAILHLITPHGSLNLHPDGSFDYTPDSGYSGPDSFTYVANDGSADSNEAIVSITVNAVNHLPVAVDDTYSTDQDVTLNLMVANGVLNNDTDVDGNPLTAVLHVTTQHGTLFLNADGSLVYTPDSGYTGPDSFTYVANDGSADSNEAIVSITVNAVNHAPVALDDPYITYQDLTLNVDAVNGVLNNDSDSDGNPLTAILQVGPQHGSLTLNPDGSFDYTPASGFTGDDSFSYVASDGLLNSGSAAVTITVITTNHSPVASFIAMIPCRVGEECLFDATSSTDVEGPIAAYDWDFFDGSAGTGVNTSHTYMSSGTFLVTLTVTDSEGLTDSFSMMVEVLPCLDTDQDGVCDYEENAASNNGDANMDGVPDSQQANVASLQNAIDGRYVTLISPAGTRLADVLAAANPSPGDAPVGIDFPLGFFSYTVLDIAPGSSVEVQMLLPVGVTINDFYKYGRTSSSPSDHWYQFLFDGTTGAEFGSAMTVHFVDGQRGDDDLTANGQIIEPGAPALSQSTGLQVQIDIVPFTQFNIVNLNSDGKLPVAILSSPSFDARFVNPATVRFAGASPVAPRPGWPQFNHIDVNHDRRPDNLLYFNVQDLQLDAADRSAELTGQTFSGQSFSGSDHVLVIPLLPPRLLYPADGAALHTSRPQFLWFPMAFNTCYQIQINNAPFTATEQSALQQATVVLLPHYRATSLPAGQYYWRVRVGGSCDVPTGPWSLVRSFDIKNP